VIDLRRLRDEPDYRAGIERKRVAPGLIDEVLALDAQHRALQHDVEEARHEQNAASKAIGKASPDERADKIAAAGALKEQLTALERAHKDLGDALRSRALLIPNPADASVPDGGEDDGEVVREVGTIPAEAPKRDHAAFAEALGLVEHEHAVDMSGSRFASLMREAVLLELALVNWVVRELVADGFVPVVPPVMVREEAMEEAGFFPTDRSQVYEVDEGELFLVGTSEVPLSALHRRELLDADALPARYAGVSTCFRREAGTYGKDTTGIFRVHQFDKVEMFAFTEPSESDGEHERLLAIEERIVGGLGLPYRVVNIAAGDLGAAAAKKYDLEVCSNYRDFSARRLGTRVRGEQGNQLVHTLNGTACAIGRTLVFLWEHYQDGDAFVVPDVLRPFTGFERVAR
jgi:seryl-tRNA synthetase